ncbi:MAG: pantetheine-phosphate adenylyltransferase [Candidatus Marinimicrobia bacterium]|nr:pantetheine-phosphate adenylyltransferase [Candidatus Neomarinimicrobiota bacterium]
MNKEIKRAIYPGTFDPVSNGHLDIIRRAGRIFDEVIVSVGINNSKTPMFSIEKRMRMLTEVVADLSNVTISSFSGLLVDYCAETQSMALIRGLRAVSDFENEMQMALVNQKIGKNIDTVFLMPNEKNTYLSSSIIREISRYGGDISAFVPPCVKKMFDERSI